LNAQEESSLSFFLSLLINLHILSRTKRESSPHSQRSLFTYSHPSHTISLNVNHEWKRMKRTNFVRKSLIASLSLIREIAKGKQRVDRDESRPQMNCKSLTNATLSVFSPHFIDFFFVAEDFSGFSFSFCVPFPERFFCKFLSRHFRELFTSFFDVSPLVAGWRC
jgi:hypothetical protein